VAALLSAAVSHIPMRILVVDDEPLARERVRALLARQPDVEIVAECGTADEAVAAAAALAPDVMLLDIDLPGRTGIEVAAAIPEPTRPVIIFVTAHDRFAVDAFDVRAVDYVMKPFDRERLTQALQRAEEQLALRRNLSLEARLETLLDRLPADRKAERICVRSDGKMVFLRPDEIWWVEAANNYSIIHLADRRRVMLRESIGALEERLGSKDFVRISRSAIVRLEHVQELEPTMHGDYTVVLRNGVRLGLSRQLRGRLEIFLPREG
jgi:two-component system LytT family response regulator